MSPELGAGPNVVYRNLNRITYWFIAGSVFTECDGKSDCAAGVKVALFKVNENVGNSITDEFGDFKFADLEPNIGPYPLKFQRDRRRDVELAIPKLDRSIALGNIQLET